MGNDDAQLHAGDSIGPARSLHGGNLQAQNQYPNKRVTSMAQGYLEHLAESAQGRGRA